MFLWFVLTLFNVHVTLYCTVFSFHVIMLLLHIFKLPVGNNVRLVCVYACVAVIFVGFYEFVVT